MRTVNLAATALAGVAFLSSAGGFPQSLGEAAAAAAKKRGEAKAPQPLGPPPKAAPNSSSGSGGPTGTTPAATTGPDTSHAYDNNALLESRVKSPAQGTYSVGKDDTPSAAPAEAAATGNGQQAAQASSSAPPQAAGPAPSIPKKPLSPTTSGRSEPVAYWAENRPPAGGPHSLPTRFFPATNWWNQDISRAPVDPESQGFIAGLAGARLMYDWGNNYGLPFSTVSGDYPKVRFAGGSYWRESDDVPYPVPIPAITEPGWTEELTATLTAMPGRGDRHLLIVDVDNHRLYEVYQPFYNASSQAVRWLGTGPLVLPGQYYCASAATWDLNVNATRPDGWTSSDAAGLQVLPGLVQYDEVTGSAPITHAHRLTLNGSARTQPYYVWPATHYAGNWSTVHPPLGARFRLRADKDISRFGPHAQKLLQSMKTYGLIFADNGTNGHITGTNDARWGNYESPIRVEFAVALSSLTFADFEVVTLGWR